MNDRVLRVLEFNKIKELVKGYAITKSAKEMVLDLKPYDSVYDVKEHLEETKEALDILMRKGNPPFEGQRNLSFRCRKNKKCVCAAVLG